MMEGLILGILFFVIVIPLVLGMTVPAIKNYMSATDVVNHDSSMRKFVYKVRLTRDEIIRLLEMKNGADELNCAVDLKKGIVTISEYGSHREYYLYIQECDDCSIIRLEQVTRIGMQSLVPYKLNSFMIQKLQAELVSFFEYEF